MTNVDIKITDNSAEVLAELARKQEAIGAELAALAVGYAKDAAPVRTGQLRDSLAGVSDETGSVTVGTDCEYGPIQEAKHHFLHDALAGHEDEYKQIMENKLKED